MIDRIPEDRVPDRARWPDDLEEVVEGQQYEKRERSYAEDEDGSLSVSGEATVTVDVVAVREAENGGVSITTHRSGP